MAGKKGMRQREKVMYDPLNLSAVSERFFREEKEAKEKAKLEKKATQAKERASKLKVKKQALNKVKENQRKITAETTKKIKTGQKQLDKQVKRLDKATVTGPLGGEIKIKTLKKISGGAPGLDRGPRSKMFIGKKFSEGGSNMDYEKEKKKIKKKTEKLSIMGAGPSPLRMLGRHLENKRRKKQRQKELAALPMKVDDFKQDHMRNQSIGEVEDFAKRVRREVGLPEPKRKGMKFDRVRKNMGGVMRNRGGTFKGVY